MSRIARLKLLADGSQLATAAGQARKLGTEVQKTGKDAAALEKELGDLSREARGVGDAVKSAGDKIRAAGAANQDAARKAQEQAKAVREQRAAFSRLRAAVDPAYQASVRFAQVQGRVAAAVKSGAVSQREANAALRAARNELTTTGAAMTGYSAKVSAASASLGGLVARLGGVFLAIEGGRRALSAGDDYTQFINQFQAMGLSADEAATRLLKISEVANRSRAPLQSTAQLYTRVSLAAGEIGASSGEVLEFTEAIGKALSSAGTSTESASGALLQLSQAMSAGTVRAEEFNSILEGAFPIALAAAKGIDEAGGSVGRLRSLVIEGKISSEQFFDAILSQADEIDATFARTSVTVRQASTQLGDSFTLLTGRLSGEAGLSGGLAEAISGVAGFVKEIAISDNLLEVAGSVGKVAIAVGALAAPFITVGVAIGAAGAYIYRNWAEISERFPAITGLIADAGQGLAKVFSAVSGAIGSTTDFVLRNLESLAVNVEAILSGNFDQAFLGLRDKIDGVLRYIPAAAEFYLAEALFFFQVLPAKIFDALTGLPDRINDVFSGFESIGDAAGASIGAGFDIGVRGLPDKARAIASDTLASLAAGLAAGVDAVVDAVTGVVDKIVSGFASLPAKIGAVLAQTPAVIVGAFTVTDEEIARMGEVGRKVPEAIANEMQSDVAVVRTAAETLVGEMIESGQITAAAGAGTISSALIAGMARGLRSKAGEALQAASELANGMLNRVRSVLQIQSPSRKFFEAGQFSAQGMAQGLIAGQQQVIDAAEKIGNAALGGVGGFVDGAVKDLFTGVGGSAKDTFDKIATDFKNLLIDMAATAVANKIKIALGIDSGVSGTGGLLGGLTGGTSGGGGGLFSKILGTAGGAAGGGTGFLGGLSNAFSGGFKSLFSVGANAAAAGGGLLASVGALVPVLGLAGLAVSLFKTKTTTLDTGLRVTIGAVDTLVESFKKVEKSRFFGLSKSRSTSYDTLGEDAAAPIVNAVATMRTSIEDMAAAVGVGSEVFDGFTTRFKISTQGLSSEAAQDAVESALKGVADSLAERAFVGTENAVDFDLIAALEEKIVPLQAQADAALKIARENRSNADEGADRAIEDRKLFQRAVPFQSEITTINAEIAALQEGRSVFIRENETASDALERISSSLSIFNQQMEYLGRTTFDVSIAAGDLASELVDMFGGVENFATANANFIAKFYSEAEQAALITNDLTSKMDGYNLTLPKSVRELRALVDAQDLATTEGQEVYAMLLNNADAFAQILPRVQELSEALQGAFVSSATVVSDQIALSQSYVAQFEQSANLWFRTAQTLREFILDLEGTDLGARGVLQQRNFNEQAFRAAAAAARAGDQEAAADIPALAQAFLSSVDETARTALEQRAAAAEIRNEVKLLAGVAKLEGEADTVTVDLYNKQITLLEELNTFLQFQGLTEDELATFGEDARALLTDFDGTVGGIQGEIDGLSKAIDGLQNLTYTGLQGDLSLIIDTSATATLPDYLKDLIQSDAGRTSRDLDIILRGSTDSDDGLLFLAANQISEHTKNLSLVLGTDRLTDQQRKLALAQSSELRRTVVVALDNEQLDPQARRLALSSASTFTTEVGAILADDEATKRATSLALARTGEFVLSVSALGDGNALDTLGKIINETGGKVTLSGGFEFDPADAFVTTLENSVVSPMKALGTSMDVLRAAIIASIEEQTAGRLDAELKGLAEARAGQVGTDLARLEGDQGTLIDRATTIFAEIRKAEAKFKVQLLKRADSPIDGSGGAAFGIRDDGSVKVRDSGVIAFTGASDLEAFRAVYKPLRAELELLDAQADTLRDDIAARVKEAERLATLQDTKAGTKTIDDLLAEIAALRATMEAAAQAQLGQGQTLLDRVADQVFYAERADVARDDAA